MASSPEEVEQVWEEPEEYSPAFDPIEFPHPDELVAKEFTAMGISAEPNEEGEE